MCFSSSKGATTPAASPAPALPSATSADVGDTRKKDNIDKFGDPKGPNYRVKRDATPNMTNNNSIKM